MWGICVHGLKLLLHDFFVQFAVVQLGFIPVGLWADTHLMLIFLAWRSPAVLICSHWDFIIIPPVCFSPNLVFSGQPPSFNLLPSLLTFQGCDSKKWEMGNPQRNRHFPSINFNSWATFSTTGCDFNKFYKHWFI